MFEHSPSLALCAKAQPIESVKLNSSESQAFGDSSFLGHGMNAVGRVPSDRDLAERFRWTQRGRCLPAFHIRQPQAPVQYDAMNLIRFIQKNFVPLNLLMECAGMSEMDIYNRTRDVFLHYKVPHDAEPPECG